MTKDEFITISQSTSDSRFNQKVLWLNNTIQEKISLILNHQYPKLRIKYKINSHSQHPVTIWFLDEIGKERNITFAISISNSQVQNIRVLEFRESRGYEIHFSAFTKQFENIGLNKKGHLDSSIDGITGATMSVSAMKKITRVALMLHQLVTAKLSSL